MTDMWTCPSCGRSFASRNQSHTCAALGDLDRHFARSGPQVRAAFDAALACVRAVGPVQVLAEKTRIALQVRMSFAAFMPRRDWLNGHLVLARRIDSPRFLRVETFSPRNVLHAFRLSGPDEVDAEFAAWLAEAYRVGAQEHLRRPLPPEHTAQMDRDGQKLTCVQAENELPRTSPPGSARVTRIAQALTPWARSTTRPPRVVEDFELPSPSDHHTGLPPASTPCRPWLPS